MHQCGELEREREREREREMQVTCVTESGTRITGLEDERDEDMAENNEDDENLPPVGGEQQGGWKLHERL